MAAGTTAMMNTMSTVLSLLNGTVWNVCADGTIITGDDATGFGLVRTGVGFGVGDDGAGGVGTDCGTMLGLGGGGVDRTGVGVGAGVVACEGGGAGVDGDGVDGGGGSVQIDGVGVALSVGQSSPGSPTPRTEVPPRVMVRPSPQSVTEMID